jgi:hypothetical protein
LNGLSSFLKKNQNSKKIFLKINIFLFWPVN